MQWLIYVLALSGFGQTQQAFKPKAGFFPPTGNDNIAAGSFN